MAVLIQFCSFFQVDHLQHQHIMKHLVSLRYVLKSVRSVSDQSVYQPARQAGRQSVSQSESVNQSTGQSYCISLSQTCSWSPHSFLVSSKIHLAAGKRNLPSLIASKINSSTWNSHVHTCYSFIMVNRCSISVNCKLHYIAPRRKSLL